MANEVEIVPQTDAFSLMDQLDDKAIMAEIEGRVVDKWVYKFQQDGKVVEGLSKVGVDQACREMASHGEVIREEDVSCQIDPTDPKYILFKASAVRVAVGKDGAEAILERTFGTKRQCTQIVSKEGVSSKPNQFWFEQGSIKALRNARMRLISEEVRSAIIVKARNAGKIQEVKAEESKPVVVLTGGPDLRSRIQKAIAELVHISGKEPSAVLVEFSSFPSTNPDDKGKVKFAETIDHLMRSDKWAHATLKRMQDSIAANTPPEPGSAG